MDIIYTQNKVANANKQRTLILFTSFLYSVILTINGLMSLDTTVTRAFKPFSVMLLEARPRCTRFGSPLSTLHRFIYFQYHLNDYLEIDENTLHNIHRQLGSQHESIKVNPANTQP